MDFKYGPDDFRRPFHALNSLNKKQRKSCNNRLQLVFTFSIHVNKNCSEKLIGYVQYVDKISQEEAVEKDIIAICIVEWRSSLGLLII
jgi:hypothetical protein